MLVQVVVFTIQRTSVVIRPLKKKALNSKNTAWLTVLIIVIASFVVNSWVIWSFELQKVDDGRFCEIKNRLGDSLLKKRKRITYFF